MTLFLNVILCKRNNYPLLQGVNDIFLIDIVI